MTLVPKAVRKEVEDRSGGNCEFPGCFNVSTEFHHRKLRSQGGKHTADNILDLCRIHHRAIHDNPKVSYERGWLVHSWDEAS
jgi:predicted restriction endonuclease